MRAARLHGIGDIRCESVPPAPDPRDDQVKLKVLAAGICGSDLHNFRTGMWMSRVPSIPGHELCGEVIEVGPAVQSLRPGDRVVADSRVTCGRCPACLRGEGNLCPQLGFVGEVCDGGFAEETLLPERGLIKVPASLAPVVAAMAEPLAVALHAVKRLAAPAEEAVAVAGAGPIGGLIALCLARSGARKIYIVDRNPERAKLVARAAGAEIAAIEALPQVRFAIDATGNSGVAAGIVSQMEKGGRAVFVGIFHDRFDIDPNFIVERELTILGSSAFADELPEAAVLLPGFAAELLPLVERPIAIGEIPAAYGRLIAGRINKVKVIVDPALPR